MAVIGPPRAVGGHVLVVGGYAELDPDGRPGLGARAHAEFAVPVIGVAKSAFRTATHAIAVLRGASARPLYVTAAGMPRTDAADLVRRMAGRYRMPDALRRADTLARTGRNRPGMYKFRVRVRDRHNPLPHIVLLTTAPKSAYENAAFLSTRTGAELRELLIPGSRE
jgi:hypothetical protein